MLAAHESGDRVAVARAGRRRRRAARRAGRRDARPRVRGAAPLHRRAAARTRATDPRVELGASPRAGLLLLRAAKARALLAGRDHALPDDVQQHRRAGARAPHRADARGLRGQRRAGRRRRGRRDAGVVASRVRPALATGLLAARRSSRPRRCSTPSRCGCRASRSACSRPAAPTWVALAARGVAVRRTLGATRVVEDEPVSIVLEVHAGRAGAADRRSCVDPLLTEPAPLRAGAARRARCASRRASRAAAAGALAPAQRASSPTRSASRPARSARGRRRATTRSSCCRASSR